MYKLLATSALVAAGLWGMTEAASAQAKVAPITAVVGGYHQQNFGFASNKSGVNYGAAYANPSGKINNTLNYSDSEIWFGGRTTLANGITVGFDVQLEGNTSGDQIDESYLFVDGAFGRIVIGSENAADYIMNYSIPGAGVAFGANESQVGDFILRPTNVTTIHTLASGRNANGANSAATNHALTYGTGNDQQRVTYFTPRMAGFQVGVSFTPNLDREDSVAYTDKSLQRANAIHGAVNFTNNFSGVQVNASLGASMYPSVDGAAATTAAGNEVKDYSVGAQIGMSGLMVGGGYRKIDADRAAENGTAYGLGAAYTSGPFSVGLSYLTSKVDGQNLTAAGDDKYKQILFSAAYSIGPGVDLIGALFNAKYESEDNLAVNQNSGTGGAVGLHLRF
jgi:hypothetical protein